MYCKWIFFLYFLFFSSQMRVCIFLWSVVSLPSLRFSFIYFFFYFVILSRIHRWRPKKKKKNRNIIASSLSFRVDVIFDPHIILDDGDVNCQSKLSVNNECTTIFHTWEKQKKITHSLGFERDERNASETQVVNILSFFFFYLVGMDSYIPSILMFDWLKRKALKYFLISAVREKKNRISSWRIMQKNKRSTTMYIMNLFNATHLFHWIYP